MDSSGSREEQVEGTCQQEINFRASSMPIYLMKKKKVVLTNDNHIGE
jgi:hypothetical protein